jgi:hypothetical protein
MNILKIALFGSAMLFSGSAFAAAPATHGLSDTYAQVLSSASPAEVAALNATANVAALNAPADATVMAQAASDEVRMPLFAQERRVLGSDSYAQVATPAAPAEVALFGDVLNSDAVAFNTPAPAALTEAA